MQLRRWSRLREIAVISPVSMERSTFVRTVLTRIAEKSLGKQVRVGPYQIPWEDGSDVVAEELVAALGLPEDRAALVDLDDLRSVAAGRVQATLMKWADRWRSLTGVSRLTSGELRGQIQRLVHHQRVHGAVARRRLSAMTVHAAKNREFDAVAVLWPYEATTDQDRARRLLYNAITRARVAAVVIVPNEKRLELPPFVERRMTTPRLRSALAQPPVPEQVVEQQVLWS
ncbi:MAG: ATP-binding domain-containing protein [Dehalococcoidia bacterium]|nr:ATP-binding domain-containing protein [Dehalococcoidia bacterium]